MEKEESIELLNQARYFVSAQQYDDALEYINKAILVDKINKELYVQKSIILANMDKIEDAIVELEKALKIDKCFAEAYFHLGNMYLLENKQSIGIENYNKAIANGYDDAQIFFNLGLMYEEDGKDDLAVRNYTKAIMRDHLRVDARVQKAKIYISNGKHHEALETLNELILADPDLFEGYHLKALLLAETGQVDEALSVLDEAMSLFPKDPAFLLDKLNIFITKNEKEKAWEIIKTLEENFEMGYEQKRQLELEKARLYATDADMDKLIDCLKKAKEYTNQVDSNDIDAEATFLLANCYLEIKDYQATIKCSTELLKSDELAYIIPAYYILPHAYKQAGEKEKAEKQFNESISKLRAITLKNPEIVDGYLFRALCLKEMEEYEKALELSEYLLKINSMSKTFHSLKAEILYAMEDEDAAKAEKAVADSLV